MVTKINILLHTMKFLLYCQKEIVAMVFIHFIVILYLFCNDILILSHDEETYLPICLLERFAIFLSAKMNLRETLHQRTKMF